MNGTVGYHSASGRTVGIGVFTPVVIQTPGGHAHWEETAGVADLARVVTAADRLGYHHLTCSEHVGIPTSAAGRRGTVYWDPLATLSWMAARTERILLATNVIVLGYHHPAELLKRYGTLDLLSGGRLVLGVGVGTLREEFDLLGAVFEGRGSRADDALGALRAGWGRPVVEYHGHHYDFGPFAFEPHAPRTHVPVWVGGSGSRSLRRAVDLADGWTPFGLDAPAIAAMLSEQELPGDGFDVVLPSGRPLDPIGAPQATAGILEELAETGATLVHASFVHHSVDHYVEQLHALAEAHTGDRP